MAIEIFNRYENKYLIDEITYKKLLPLLNEKMELDSFNRSGEPYSISNIYYDTPDHELIRNSLAKPTFKEKLRLRAYGIPSQDTLIYAEIKKKYRGIVNKRRTSLMHSEAFDFMANSQADYSKPYINKQVLKEIEYMLNRYDLYPSMYIAYDRWAYFDKGDHDLRISFDNNIRYRDTNLTFEKGSYGNFLLNKGFYLMEVKCSGNVPLWLSNLLAEYNIYPVSFSKYGNAYKKICQIQIKQTNRTRSIMIA